MPTPDALCIYCGSRPGRDPRFLEEAAKFGALLAAKGIRMVYGGGATGLMGAVADGVLGAGGHVEGVIPRGLLHGEKGHRGLTRQHVVDTMHERKAKMIELSQGFVALPGGFGTLEEIFEVLTWSQLGLHPYPCGFLNIAGYWSPLATMIDHISAEHFIDQAHRDMVLVEADPARLLERMGQFERSAPAIWKI